MRSWRNRMARDTPPDRRPPDRRRIALRLAGGACAGWLALHALGGLQVFEAFPILGRLPWWPIAGSLGALIALTRLRAGIWAAAILLWLLSWGVAWTPLAGNLLRGVAREDPLGPADAVVVLSSTIREDGSLPPRARGRVGQGLKMLEQGYARILVVTRLRPPLPSAVPAIREEMRRAEQNWAIEEVGPVQTTREEAVAVARLARQRRWQRVVLVSNPSHLRRAGRLFEAQGLPVLCSPAPPPDYAYPVPRTPQERQAAFRDWLYETYHARSSRPHDSPSSRGAESR